MAFIDYIHRIVQPLPMSILEYFHYPQEKPCPCARSLSLPSASPGLPLVSRLRICLLGLSVESHARRLWCLPPFPQPSVFEVQPGWGMGQNFIPFYG